MNVLSLFDGMSCGRIALERAGIRVDNYYAAEIDKYAIQVSEKNYPDIIRLGDVVNWRKWVLPKIDLILAGSPCQGFSFAGKQLAFDDPRSKLFFTFIDIAMHHVPRLFLLENVKMKKEYQDIISKYMGCEPIEINSALVSAQNRKRLYWTNIPVEQPEDRGIYLKDILIDGSNEVYQRGRGNNPGGIKENKSPTITSSRWEENHKIRTKSKTIRVGGRGSPPFSKQQWDGIYEKPLELSSKELAYMDRKVKGGRSHWDFGHHSDTDDPKSSAIVANFSEGVPYNVLIDRTKSKDIPNQINPAKDAAGKQPYMQDRVFHIDNKTHALTASFAGRTNVGEDDEITWRKLSPIECERLQTVPDRFTEGVSNSQRFKMLGNGWTVDVIAHILSGIKV